MLVNVYGLLMSIGQSFNSRSDCATNNFDLVGFRFCLFTFFFDRISVYLCRLISDHFGRVQTCSVGGLGPPKNMTIFCLCAVYISPPCCTLPLLGPYWAHCHLYFHLRHWSTPSRGGHFFAFDSWWIVGTTVARYLLSINEKTVHKMG